MIYIQYIKDINRVYTTMNASLRATCINSNEKPLGVRAGMLVHARECVRACVRVCVCALYLDMSTIFFLRTSLQFMLSFLCVYQVSLVSVSMFTVFSFKTIAKHRSIYFYQTHVRRVTLNLTNRMLPRK